MKIELWVCASKTETEENRGRKSDILGQEQSNAGNIISSNTFVRNDKEYVLISLYHSLYYYV